MMLRLKNNENYDAKIHVLVLIVSAKDDACEYFMEKKRVLHRSVA